MLCDQIKPFHNILYELKDYWHFRAFDHCGLGQAHPWESKSPELAQYIRTLSLDDFDRFEEKIDAHSSEFISLISRFEPAFQQLQSLALINPQNPQISDISHLKNHGMKQRKSAQIDALLPLIHFPQEGNALEWCGGKGHLSRALAQQSTLNRYTVIDWDQSLIAEGKSLSQDLKIDFYVTDALSEESHHFLSQNDYIFAIHACGALHRKVIEHSNRAIHQGLWIAPCCYHLDTLDAYVPMSHCVRELQKETCFDLDRYLLRLATQQRIHGSERRHQLRQRSAAFRLGFNALIKDELKLPLDAHLPSLSRAELRQSFREVCFAFARFTPGYEKELSLLSDAVFDRFENQGYQQLLHIIPVEQIRHLFRRALEHWLCFDRAIALEEKGFDTQIISFCDMEVTPRNLLLMAKG